LDHPHPVGSTGLSEAILTLNYDPSVLTVNPSDIALGSLPSQGSGWQITSVVDAAKGQIAITMFSMTPITALQGGSLVDVNFHLVAGATVSTTAVQLANSVAPYGHQVGLLLADTQGALILSPGVNQVMLATGYVSPLDSSSRSTNVATETQGIVAITSAATENTASIVLGSEANDGLAVISNGAVGGDGSHTVPAGLVVTGALAFQTNGAAIAATQLVGQVTQVVNAPMVNILQSLNNPQQFADQLFLALARGTEAPVSQDSVNSLIWEGIGLQQDWLTVPTQGTQSDATTDTANQPAVSNSTTAVDQVFAQLAETDDFSDFGDY
jgi:hypothetical protein